MTSERAPRPATALLWVGILGAAVALAVMAPDPAAVRRLLESVGPFAPLAYALAEVVQVVIMPIPGQPFEVAGGWLLGMTAGTLVGSAGAIAGSMVAFRLARRFGHGWVRRHVSERVHRRVVDGLGRGQRAEWLVFWLMMIPNFPRDPLCFVAGISGMSARRFFLIALLGRPVGLVPWVALGAGGAAAAITWQLWMIAGAGAIWILMRLVPGVLSSATDAPEPQPKL